MTAASRKREPSSDDDSERRRQRRNTCQNILTFSGGSRLWRTASAGRTRAGGRRGRARGAHESDAEARAVAAVAEAVSITAAEVAAAAVEAAKAGGGGGGRGGRGRRGNTGGNMFRRQSAATQASSPTNSSGTTVSSAPPPPPPPPPPPTPSGPAPAGNQQHSPLMPAPSAPPSVGAAARLTELSSQSSSSLSAQIVYWDDKNDPIPSEIRKLTPAEEDVAIRHKLSVDERKLLSLSKKFWDFILAIKEGAKAGSARLKLLEFISEVEHYELALTRFELHNRSNEAEVLHYQNEKRLLEAEIIEAGKEIEVLRARLEEASKERENRIEYDKETNNINKYPSRADSKNTIAALQADNANLRAEQEKLNALLELRAQQFRALFVQAQAVRDDVRDVKRNADGSVQQPGENGSAGSAGQDGDDIASLRKRRRRGPNGEEDDDEEEEGLIREEKESEDLSLEAGEVAVTTEVEAGEIRPASET